MSEEPNIPNEQRPAEDTGQGAAAEPTPVPAPAAPPVTARFNEVHTPTNTSMKNRLSPQSALIRPLTEEEIASGYLTIFLGNSKASRTELFNLIRPYMDLVVIRDMHRHEKIDDSVLQKAEAEWANFVERTFPDNTLEEITERARHALQFHNEIIDELKCRSNAIREEGITNVFDRGGLMTGDIVGRKPGANVKGMKSSQIMRRKSTRAEDGRLAFDLLLRNSYVKTTMNRPNKADIGILIDDIKEVVKGYVRQVNNNSAVIARIAIGRVIWNFFLKHLTYSSVNDIADFKQLSTVVRWSDIDAITTGILRAYTKKGVNMHLVCSNPTCNWHEMGLIDPEKICHARTWHDTDEESAIYANLINDKVTYSIAETLALIKEASFGLDTNKVYNEDNSIYMELASPSMADAFATLDYFLGEVNPKIQACRERNISQEDFEEKRNLLFAELGATEYIHWIDKFVSVATPNTDEKDVVLERDQDDDPNDFNEGLIDHIKESAFVQHELTKAILRKTPFLSKTFVGLQNYVCPKCKNNQEIFEDPEGLKERKLGYTPIDPIMSFFILIQLVQVHSATENLAARAQALSELEN